MFDDLKATGNKIASRRLIFGLVAVALAFILFHFNVFKLSPDAIRLWLVFTYGMFALTVVTSIVDWGRAKNNNVFKGIEKFCNATANPEETMTRLEKTWKEGFDFKMGRIDKDYIIYIPGVSSEVISIKTVVWAFKKKIKASCVYLVLYFEERNHRMVEFNNGIFVDTILDYISKNCPDIAIGREEEIENLYKNKDMEGLKRYARAMRKKGLFDDLKAKQGE